MSRAGLPDCVRCGKPVPDQGYACPGCGDRLARALLQLAELAGEVTVEVAKQARHGARAAAGSPEPPMPYAPGAADVAWAAGNTVVAWMVHVAERRGVGLPPPAGRPIGPLCPAGWNAAPGRCGHGSCDAVRARTRQHPIGRAAVWLAGHVDWLRHRADAPEAFDELHYAAAMVRAAVQGPTDRWYAGPCGEQLPETGEQCAAELYARPGSTVVRCTACGFQHDADARKQWLLDAVEDILAPASMLAAAATSLGRPITAAAIRGYAHRGRLMAKGLDAWARPTYRFGDVLDLIDQAEEAERVEALVKAQRAAKKAARHDGDGQVA